MGSKKNKDSGWREIDGGMAFIIPLSLLRHPNLRRSSPYTCKLLFDLGTQYTGFNNGYLCASWALMQHQGWNSPTTLHKAVAEAEHYRFLERTQQGGKNKPNLHALSWRKIDAKPGQPLELGPTFEPSNAWKLDQTPFVLTVGEEGRSTRRKRLRKAA
jgi:hypothetical protein